MNISTESCTFHSFIVSKIKTATTIIIIKMFHLIDGQHRRGEARRSRVTVPDLRCPRTRKELFSLTTNLNIDSHSMVSINSHNKPGIALTSNDQTNQGHLNTVMLSCPNQTW